MLIGLCGAAGAGKNTVADILGWRQTSFAAPLYRMLAAMTGMTVRQLQDRDAKERTIAWLGKSPRELLQSLGTEWGRQTVADDVWIRATLREVRGWLQADEHVVITDVRFTNEAEAIRAAGGRVFRVVRPGVACLAPEAAAHASERGIPDHLVDAEIVNQGGLDELRHQVMVAILREGSQATQNGRREQVYAG